MAADIVALQADRSAMQGAIDELKAHRDFAVAELASARERLTAAETALNLANSGIGSLQQELSDTEDDVADVEALAVDNQDDIGVLQGQVRLAREPEPDRGGNGGQPATGGDGGTAVWLFPAFIPHRTLSNAGRYTGQPAARSGHAH